MDDRSPLQHDALRGVVLALFSTTTRLAATVTAVDQRQIGADFLFDIERLRRDLTRRYDAEPGQVDAAVGGALAHTGTVLRVLGLVAPTAGTTPHRASA